MEQKNGCCETKKDGGLGKGNEGKRPNGMLEGIVYGLIPHTGCVAFILFAILGATTMSALFQPLLMSKSLFYGLMLMSFAFATLSAIIYLNKRGLLSAQGMAKSKGYLSVLYGTTIGVNLLFFFVIFPILANAVPGGAAPSVAASVCPLNSTSECSQNETAQLSALEITVDIPCSGHAPLIATELYALDGVRNVEFAPTNRFTILYDPSITTKTDILNLRVFKTYHIIEIGGAQ
jgi:hypothetical protein